MVLLPTTTTAVLLIKQSNIELTIMRSRILTMEVQGLPVVVLYGGKWLGAKLSVNKLLIHMD